MKLITLLEHHYVKNVRQLLAHLAVGLGFSWLCLMTLELWRPGAAVWYLNLNFLLASFLAAWTVAERPAQPGKPPYAPGLTFAILVVATAVALSVFTPWRWWAPFVVLVGVLAVARSTSAIT